MREFVADFSKCETVDHLAIALGIDRQLLELLAGDKASTFYHLHKIPKRSKQRRGTYRAVFEPISDELKLVHKALARRLSLYATHANPSFPRDCVFGYIRRRSTRDNATRHRGARLVLKADIRDFFPSISPSRVEAIFRQLNVKQSLATLLSRIFCFSGSLAPGLSGSPLIANLACHELDSRLLEVARRSGATYTRYADDISFSGDTLPHKAELITALEAEGFSLSESKYRVTKKGQAQFVTGLSVTDPARPHAPRELKRRLRQELYYCRKYGIVEHLEKIKEKIGGGINRIDGTVKYVSFIERDTSHDHRSEWDALLTRDDKDPTYHPKHDIPTRAYFVAIDETTLISKGSEYLALACVPFSELEKIEGAAKETLGDYFADPFIAGKRAAIAKEGLHYAAAHPELRNKFIAKMPALPFRCYIALKKLVANDEYRATYLSLLQWNLWVILTRYDRQELKLFVEQNPRITEQDVKTVVAEAYDLLTKAGSKRPLTEPTVEVVSKVVPYIAIPDFMLGVLGSFVKSSGEEGAAARLQFERLRDRYSLIFDLDNKTPYSRRHPFHAEALETHSSALSYPLRS